MIVNRTEEMNFNWTSEENSFDNSFNISESMNTTHRNHSDNSDYDIVKQIIKWGNLITIGIGLPSTLIVIVAVFLQVKKDQGVPVYVINLLFSDLVQFCGRITVNLEWYDIGRCFTYFGLTAGVGFMVCISLERYLVIAKPLWYRFRRNIKTYVVVCVVVWTLPLSVLLPLILATERTAGSIIYEIIVPGVFLLPFPFFIFFLVGTIKALSGALSVPAEEKRRIVAIQVVVLLIYSLLFLPMITVLLLEEYSLILDIVAIVCLYISPLADTTLYLLTRKSILDKFLASLCSCKASDNQEMSSNDTESTTAPHTETV
ncbi:G-protein coupled receptor 4-like [Fundulus heteroclitus]|uniref:G-protein coupled receptor 4-like n=1 Tax=Fundulus heteroclitus TaxID=8078 RepID=UPI00165C82AD|nr:G-protein coupled receptor 4-like [Fundulus heteroclitus]